MATFPTSTTGVLFAGVWSTTQTAGYQTVIGRNSELWIRIYGDSLKVRYTSINTDPIAIKVDSNSWVTPTAGSFIATATKTLSGELLPAGTSDGWHDVRIRVKDFYQSNFRIAESDGFEIVSSGGSADLTAHSDYGDFQTLRGTFGAAWWLDTLSSTNIANASGYTANTFPAAVPSGGTTACNCAFVEFKVDSTATKFYVLTNRNGETSLRTFSVLVDGVRFAPSYEITINSIGQFGFAGPYTIPGTGTRTVRISSIQCCHSIITDGAFVAEKTSEPTRLVYLSGDSVTEGGRWASQPDPSGQAFNLISILRPHLKMYNRGKSGDTATAWNAAASSAGRIADFDPNAELVIANLSINDASGANSNPSGTQTQYENYYNKLLTQCPDATIVAVPQLPYYSTFRTQIKSVIESAVAAINNPRLVYRSSDNWVSGGGDLVHPEDLKFAQSVGGGVAAINVSGQPADGNTVTINGTVFEFDSNASVTGSNVAVTIGATLADTIENLFDAISNSATTADLLAQVITPSASTSQGVVVSNCTSLAKSGTNINVYGPEAAGWIDIFDEFLPPSSGGGAVNMLLLGVG